MAKQQIFSVYDTKAEEFSSPFYSPTLGSGERAYNDAVADPESALAKHPEDYHLYHLGSFDTESGLFDPMQPHRVI